MRKCWNSVPRKTSWTRVLQHLILPSSVVTAEGFSKEKGSSSQVVLRHLWTFLLFLLLHWSHFQRGSCFHSCGQDDGWRSVIAFSKSLANANNNRKWKNVVYNFTFSYCLSDRGINKQQNYQKASNVLIIYQLNKEILNKLHNII